MAGISLLFGKRKEQWLPLYKRLAARLSHIPGLAVVQKKGFFALTYEGNPEKIVAKIRVKPEGLQISFQMRKKKKAHPILISEPSHIDEELLSYVKATKASHLKPKARTSKRQST